jgi:hypothetical protein
MRGLKNIDVEAANLPTFRPRTRLTPILSPRLLKGATIPKPILRLVVFIAFLLSGVMLLQTVTQMFFTSATVNMNGHYMPPQAASIHLSRPLVAGKSAVTKFSLFKTKSSP